MLCVYLATWSLVVMAACAVLITAKLYERDTK